MQADITTSAFCRMLHTDRRTLQNPVRNILDGELLTKYLYLSTMERSELAKKIGTTSDIVSRALVTPRKDEGYGAGFVCVSNHPTEDEGFSLK